MTTDNIPTEQTYKTLLLLWFALFVSHFIFLFLIYVAKPEVYKFDPAKPLLGENAPIVLIFAFIAITKVVVSFVMKKTFLNKAIETQNPNLIQTALIFSCAL